MGKGPKAERLLAVSCPMHDTVRIWGRGAGGGEVLSAMRKETKTGTRPRRALPAMKRKCGCLPERNGEPLRVISRGWLDPIGILERSFWLPNGERIAGDKKDVGRPR